MSRRVVIVGAGVIGLFCALRLAKGGAQVVVLEAEQETFSVYGPTASLAAAGMLAPLAEAWGDPAQQELALASFDLWRKHSPGALWEDGVRFDGAVLLSGDPANAIERVCARGRAGELLNSAQARKRTGFPELRGEAAFIADEGVADPIRTLSGLAMDARRHGVQTLFSQDVSDVSGHEVKTYEGGVYEADAVVLAPGAWATQTLKEAAPALRHIRPAKGQIVPVLAAKPLGPNLHAEGFYLARRMESDIVLGASLELGRSDRHVNEARAEALLAAAERVLPGALTRRERGWAGVRPMSPDGAPMVGKSNDVFIAAGHGRQGWLLAPLTAEIIAAQVLGAELDTSWGRYRPDRFGEHDHWN